MSLQGKIFLSAVIMRFQWQQLYHKSITIANTCTIDLNSQILSNKPVILQNQLALGWNEKNFFFDMGPKKYGHLCIVINSNTIKYENDFDRLRGPNFNSHLEPFSEII